MIDRFCSPVLVMPTFFFHFLCRLLKCERIWRVRPVLERSEQQVQVLRMTREDFERLLGKHALGSPALAAGGEKLKTKASAAAAAPAAAAAVGGGAAAAAAAAGGVRVPIGGAGGAEESTEDGFDKAYNVRGCVEKCICEREQNHHSHHSQPLVCFCVCRS